MNFKSLFNGKVRALSDELARCEKQHEKLQEDLDKLQKCTPRELLLEQLEKAVLASLNSAAQAGRHWSDYGYNGGDLSTEAHTILSAVKELLLLEK